MGTRVVIVGGGLAGLSAAACLALHGLAVTLLESRPRLGGRAGSFLDSTTGEWIDTCQHVGMGCCTNLLHFLRMVGIDDLFREERELTFIGPAGERHRFRDHAGPAPLHLAGALSGLPYLSFIEKVRLGFDLRRLSHPHWANADSMSFEEWLQQHGRTSHVRDRFWDVILVSALSEPASRISVRAARKVFVDGFLAHRTGWRVHLPTAPLDEIYGHRLREWLTSQGAIVRTQAGVERFEEQGARVTGVRLRSGERMEGDQFVLAVPWHRVGDVVPLSLIEHPTVTAAGSLESAPISSVHLWFDRPVMDVPHAVLVGRLSQWVFARPQAVEADGARRAVRGGQSAEVVDPHGDASEISELRSEKSISKIGSSIPPPQPSTLDLQPSYLQVVISASHAIVAKPQAEIVAEVVRELGEIWSPVKSATLLHGRVVTEHRAVFSPQPGVERLRPSQQSPMENLQLAGDWTKTGWPATMEGAVRSGYLAAENVLRRQWQDVSLVQAGLPVSWLARVLFGLSRENRL